MRKLTLIAGLLAFTLSTNAQVKKTVVATKVTAQTIQLHTFSDTLSYVLGLSMAKFYKNQGLKQINTNLLSSAVNSVMHNDSNVVFTDNQIGEILMGADSRLATEKAAVAKAQGAAFLSKNKTNAGVVTLPDGIQYLILQKGAGKIPADSNNVKVNYVGKLLNGTEFDNSYKRNEPMDLGVTSVIKGWTEILTKMPVGSKWRVWIPSDFAYGDRGAGQGTIPPGATLEFEIELLGINN